MCGIAGFIEKANAPERLDRMLTTMRTRGPDGAGKVAIQSGDWHVHLGHRRLSIIDLEGGKQPMHAPAGVGEASITYNGEVYNFLSLRDSWSARGVSFATRSDTEAVLVHVARRGPEGLADLDGMFAFALWSDERLLLARDRYGIKPLYYASLADGGIVFGSELASLLTHDSIERRLDPAGVLSYFASDYAHAPLTLIRGVRKLEPGAYVEWHDGKLSTPTRYWTLPPLGTATANPKPDELWTRLEEAVQRQLIADVPVGVLLSGGIDSSCIGVAAKRSSPNRRLHTFSIGFQEASFDESEYARLMARHIGSEHHERILGAREVLDVLDEALARLDEPVGDHAYLPNFVLCEMAAKHVKVALGGDACDELWGGYPTYRAHLYASLYAYAAPVLHPLLRDRIVPRIPVSDGYQSWDWKVRKFVDGWDGDDIRRHLRWMSSATLDDLALGVPGGHGRLPAVFETQLPAHDGSVAAAMAVDFLTYLPGSILPKVDRSSMAHGLEVRPPFLDNAFVEWSLAQPIESKVGPLGGKLLVKAAARPHVPSVILDRKKRGFGMPVVAWIRGVLQERVQNALDDDRLFEGSLLDRSTFRKWNDLHCSGRADYGKLLWSLVVLHDFCRRHDVSA